MLKLVIIVVSMLLIGVVIAALSPRPDPLSDDTAPIPEDITTSGEPQPGTYTRAYKMCIYI